MCSGWQNKNIKKIHAQDVVNWAFQTNPVAKTSGLEWPGISKKELQTDTRAAEAPRSIIAKHFADNQPVQYIDTNRQNLAENTQL